MFKTHKSYQEINMVHQFKTNLIDQDSNVGQVHVKTEPNDVDFNTAHKPENVCRPLCSEQLTSATKLEFPGLDSGSPIVHQTMYRTVNPIYKPKPDCFTLPDVRNPDFIQDNIKMEPNEGTTFAVSPKVEHIHDGHDSSTKLKDPDLNCDSEIYEQDLENLTKKINVEDHATTYPEASKHVSKRLNHSSKVRRPPINIKSRNTVHACLHCTKGFKSLEDLEKHHLRHERVEIRNKCLQCGKTFKVLNNLKNHMKMHSLEETNRYPQVSKQNLPSVIEARPPQLQNKNPDEIFQEVVQHKMPRLEENPRVNDKRNHHKDTHECIHCGKQFVRKDDLTSHILSHLGFLPHECSMCGKTFNRKHNLHRHLLSHTGDKPFRCGHCGKSYGLRQYLNIHLLSHNQSKCNRCERKFINKEELNRHVLSNCTTSSFKCNQCVKTFVREENLHKHMFSHKITDSYKCFSCEKTFPKKELLKVHMLSHSQKNSHDCSECGKSFSAKYLLDYHLSTHKKEKPYRCSQCVKSFVRKSILNRHILLHLKRNCHEGKPCKKCFLCKSGKNENTLLHSGEPYGSNQLKTEEPTETNQPAEYVEINQPIEPAEYVEINWPVEPTEENQPAEYVEINWPIEPTETNQPAEYVDINRHEHLEPVEINRPKPVEPVEINWPIEQIETNQPAEYVEINWPIEPIETIQPLEPIIELNTISTKKHVPSYKPTDDKKAKNANKCSQCGKVFVRMDDFNNHVLSHAGQNPHKCSQCGKTFNRKHNLKRHKNRIHSADKPK